MTKVWLYFQRSLTLMYDIIINYLLFIINLLKKLKKEKWKKRRIGVTMSDFETLDEFKIRNDGVGHIPMIDEIRERGYALGSELRAILQQEYPYLYSSFKSYIGLDICDSNKYGFLKEVVCDNKVVGFAIYTTYGSPEGDVLILDLIYILPEYRCKGVLYDELKDILSLKSHSRFFVDCPNYFMIKSLIKHGYGVSLNEHLIYFPDIMISTHKEGATCPYPVYDLRIKSGVNPYVPSLTPTLDRDIMDRHVSFIEIGAFFNRYKDPVDYFREVASILDEYLEKEGI